MAEYTVKHTCGHEVKHRYDGPDDERRRRQDWLRAKPCQKCWHAEQADVAAVQRDELNLPPLEGSESEIQWAEVVRAKAIKHNRDFYTRVTRKPKNPHEQALHEAIVTAADRAMSELESESTATWWIENRFDVINHIRQATIKAVEPILNEGDD